MEPRIIPSSLNIQGGEVKEMPKKETQIEYGKSYMFVSNHTSMADIMVMLAVEKNPFVFVGKKELSKIPIFGFFYKRTCILVDRIIPVYTSSNAAVRTLNLDVTADGRHVRMIQQLASYLSSIRCEQCDSMHQVCEPARHL